MQTEQTGYAETNGQRLYYEVYGEGDPLLLITGLGGNCLAWMPQIPAFAEHFKVIVFDNRDAGRSSEAEGPYTFLDMAHDTAGLMDELGIEKAHVLGQSMGGAIAQELVIGFPGKVNKLILACTSGQVARFRVSMLERDIFIRKNDPDKRIFYTHLLLQCMTHNFLKNAEAVDAMMAGMSNAPFPQSDEAFCRQAEAAKDFDALDRLGGVTAPTLVMVGDQDIVMPPWGAKELAAAIPGAQLEILEGGAHFFFQEMKDRVNKTVIDFLKD